MAAADILGLGAGVKQVLAHLFEIGLKRGKAVVLLKLGRLGRSFLAQRIGVVFGRIGIVFGRIRIVFGQRCFGHYLINLDSIWAVKSTMGTMRA